VTSALFLSLRPNFAELILGGTKTVEVRRVIPRTAAPGSLILLYASSPERALLGMCFLDEIRAARPETIWRRSGDQTGLKKKEFMDYLEGVDKGVALHVSRPIRFARPIPLAEIRESWDGFRPPQSFSYVGVPEVVALATLAAATVPLFYT
jgi:predicted transcriptional regulator